MAKVDKYRSYIQSILKEYASHKPTYGEVEVELIFDSDRDHYQVVHAGWNKDHRVYGCVIHIDIKQEKIWIQYNGTEVDFAEELVSLGVPKEDIVLAFHAPYKRQYTGFAVG
ncbi:MAG: XisI protein [Xenococcaceae cyanobacterium MO_207.B15]|nr:XisI protein [Xenococcaceae cyanobacterium MO_207.B15]